MFNDCFYIERIKQWMIREANADTIYEQEKNHLRWCYYLEGLKDVIGKKKSEEFHRQAKKEIKKERRLIECQK